MVDATSRWRFVQARPAGTKALWVELRTTFTIEVAAKEAFEPLRGFELLDERTYGAARVLFLRLGASNSS